MAIVEEAPQPTVELGGQLQTPKMSWKQRWIQNTPGWLAAKQVQLTCTNEGRRLLRSWDKVMCQLERRKANRN
jgi:hypothetical protein